MTALTTPDQMRRLHVAQIRSAIKLWVQAKILVNRRCKIGDLLRMAHLHTQRGPYPNTPAGHQQAFDDLTAMLEGKA